MKHFFSLIVLFSFWGNGGTIFAQKYSLLTYSVEEGLAQSQVYSMLEDQRGSIWMGTRGGGISRFDGLNFENFGEKDGLVNNFINCLTEDHKGNIWVGTDAGASRFDGKQFHNYFLGDLLPASMVLSVRELRKNVFLFGTSGGLFLVEFLPNGIKKQLINPGNELPLSVVYDIFIDSHQYIWISTQKGLARADSRKINFQDPIQFQNFTLTHGLSHQYIRQVFEDKDQKIWVCTYGGGLCVYDPAIHSLSEEKPFKKIGPEEGFNAEIVFNGTQDAEGTLWFTTLRKGACRYDGKNFSWITESEGLQSNHVRAVLQDSWGNIWLGTSGGGASRFYGQQFMHYTEKDGLPGSRVYAIHEDSIGNLWIGTSAGGISHYDCSYFEHFNEADGFNNVTVKAIYKDRSGTMWFGSEGNGLSRMDSSTFTHFTKENGLTNNWIKTITEPVPGEIWAGTAGGGICIIKEDGIHTLGIKEGLTSSRINVLLTDKEGRVWIGTRDKGVNVYHEERVYSIAYSDGLCSDAVRSLSLDEEGAIWVGTSKGVSKIIPESRNKWKVECINSSLGLSSNNIYLTALDLKGNVWAGSEKGVDQLVIGNEGNLREIRHFGFNEGFLGIETCQRAAWTDKSGSIWFGTINGMVKYNPQEKNTTSQPPISQITTIKLFYEDLTETHSDKELTDWYFLPQNLSLKYDQNHLGFEFIGVDLSSPEKVKYKWKMEGFDHNWSPVSRNRNATYANLPPGKYTFKMMAVNGEGIWNPVPETFEFEIRRPFWASWLFRATILCLLILIAIGLFQWRIRKIKRSSEEKNRQIQTEKQILELEQKALRLQMNPHFIFNALNSIKGCIAVNDTVAARKYLVKFARLMRLILDNSRETFIPLEKEIETLELYLDIEKLSKSDKFDYHIEIDSEIDPSHTVIPPMLVQPFVENAVIHGISALEKNGQILIRFLKTGNELRCEIQDNGLGIQHTEKAKKHSGLHKSAGIAVTQERLNLLNPSKKHPLSIQFENLDNPSGTRVIIQLPYESLY